MSQSKSKTMPEKITPKIDIAFKKLFGVEENKDLLISLINSIVSEEDQVKEVELLNPYNLKNFQTEKLSILDIKAKSHTGKLYNIEIQISNDGDYDNRALYYWGKLYTEQLRSSGSYRELNKAIGIHILNFISVPSKKNYHNVFKVYDEKDKEHFFKDFELHTIELSKFENNKIDQKLSEADLINQLIGKIKTSLDRWAAFLTRNDLIKNNKFPKELKGPEIEKALEVLDIMNFNNEERETYEGRLKWWRMEESTLRKLEEESIEKGLAKGLVKGLVKGRAEGRAERDVEIVENMLSQGIDINMIATITGLTEKQIQKIGKE